MWCKKRMSINAFSHTTLRVEDINTTKCILSNINPDVFIVGKLINNSHMPQTECHLQHIQFTLLKEEKHFLDLWCKNNVKEPI